MISFVSGYYGWLGNQMFQYAATKALALPGSGARSLGRLYSKEIMACVQYAASEIQSGKQIILYRFVRVARAKYRMAELFASITMQQKPEGFNLDLDNSRKCETWVSPNPTQHKAR